MALQIHSMVKKRDETQHLVPEARKMLTATLAAQGLMLEYLAGLEASLNPRPGEGSTEVNVYPRAQE